MVKISAEIHDEGLLEQVKALLESHGVVYYEEKNTDEVREYLHSELQTIVSGEAKFISLEEMERRLNSVV